ncbi:hypothetical protein A6X20_16745 [Bradyrhizobium elkanii]|nr:hypothetical protein A6452_39020 [Bradyrhizobium elkanii]ODM82768.1 hypothetical protein A6X20_16745 [Bradyrhizobium elkanii]
MSRSRCQSRQQAPADRTRSTWAAWTQREQNFTVQLIWSIKDIRTEMILAQEASHKLGREVDSFRCPNVDTNLAGEIGLVKSAEMAFTSEGLNLNTKLSGSSGRSAAMSTLSSPRI